MVISVTDDDDDDGVGSISQKARDFHALNMRLSYGLRVILWHFNQREVAMNCWDDSQHSL